MSLSKYEYKYRKYKAKFIAARKIQNNMHGGTAKVTSPDAPLNTSPSSELFNTADWNELFRSSHVATNNTATAPLFDQYLETAPVLLSNNSDNIEVSDTSDMNDIYTGDAGQVFATPD